MKKSFPNLIQFEAELHRIHFLDVPRRNADETTDEDEQWPTWSSCSGPRETVHAAVLWRWTVAQSECPPISIGSSDEQNLRKARRERSVPVCAAVSDWETIHSPAAGTYSASLPPVLSMDRTLVDQHRRCQSVVVSTVRRLCNYRRVYYGHSNVELDKREAFDRIRPLGRLTWPRKGLRMGRKVEWILEMLLPYRVFHRVKTELIDRCAHFSPCVAVLLRGIVFAVWTCWCCYCRFSFAMPIAKHPNGICGNWSNEWKKGTCQFVERSSQQRGAGNRW